MILTSKRSVVDSSRTMTSVERHLNRQLIARLRLHADDVRRLTTGLDDGALERRTVPEKWSLAELACHLWRVQQLFEERLDAMLQRDEPTFESYAPENDLDFPRLVAFRRGREAVCVFLEARERFVCSLETLGLCEWRSKASYPLISKSD